MILTEEEARTKWCPFARCATGTAGSIRYGTPVYNRLVMPDGETNYKQAGQCIASACMAWKVVDDGVERHWVKNNGHIEGAHRWVNDRIIEEGRAQAAREREALVAAGFTKVADAFVGTGWEKPNVRPPTGCCGLADRDVTVER